ncbi:MAG: hypothetical protein K0S46_1251 [Moraxellaceae bacterium]|nr:hypothetical protein [Moraxellaceae bacterium]
MKWWLRSCVVLLCVCAGFARAAIELAATDAEHPVHRELTFLRDDSATLGLGQVLALPRAHWQQNDADVFSRGYNGAAWWLRFDVRVAPGYPEAPLLEVAYPVLDEVEVWLLADGRQQAHFRMGDKLPFASRSIAHRYFLAPLQMQPGQDYTVLLRVRTSSSVQVPVKLWQKGAYIAHDQMRLVSQGIYFGAMLAMVLYNFFVFLLIRERNYAYYVLYVLSMLFFLASLNGLAFQFLWPEATDWNDQAIIVTLSGTVLFGVLFTSRFLQAPRHLPRVMPAMRALMAASVLIMVLAFFLSYALLIRLAIVVAAGACAAGLVVGVLRWRQGDVSARYYAIAWSAMLMGGIILALNKFQVLPQNLVTENATQLGSILEVLLLSFALAERINQEKRLRFEAQQEALQSERRARLAQAEVLDTQRRANEELEQHVQARTRELEIANLCLAELSATDQLTGLRNRRFLDDLLREEFVRCYRYRHSIAVLLLDIDHFKHFNDSHGHLVGDDCLRYVARTLKTSVRSEVDRVARFGGEEFCVVLPETDAEGARVVAERIRTDIEAMVFLVEGRAVPVSVSVGVAALVPVNAGGYDALLAATDRALYAAKAAGRNRVVVASEGEAVAGQ